MRTTLIISLLLVFSFLSAQLQLPSVITDYMVLQQQSNVAIWGKAVPNKEVVVKTGWDNQTYRAKATSDSLWQVKVTTPVASFNEYTLSINSDKVVREIKGILIGEVWLCSGQSNMDMKMRGYISQPVTNSTQDIALSSNNYLRCYTVDKVSSVKVKDNTKGSWLIASPNTTADFTATGYYFGRFLQQALNVPVGLLSCSWGGSSIEAWMSADAFGKFSSYELPASEADNTVKNKTPTVLFNGMLKSILGYGMRGAIWYQGETNRLDYKNYPALFESMHADWISQWGVGTFPIYFCQIAPYQYGQGSNSAFMREAQLQIARNQPNTGMAVLSDAGEATCIHPANKQVAGERLAYIALGKTYGFDKFPCQSPELQAIRATVGKIIVRFDKAPDGISTFGNELTGFEIAGDDRKFYPAKAKIVQKTVELTAVEVPQPVAVRYGFKDFFKGSLYGVNGLPVSSFRSDDWDDIK